MSGPETGPASRLQGSEARGTDPKACTSSGDTAAWAATVTASGAVSHRGPGSARSSRVAPATMPPAPATDSWKPSEVTSSGSTSTMAATPSASVRADEAGRPSAVPTAATAAIAVARSTEGSARVTRANIARPASVAPSRGPNRSRASTGPATTSTKATF